VDLGEEGIGTDEGVLRNWLSSLVLAVAMMALTKTSPADSALPPAKALRSVSHAFDSPTIRY